MYGTTLQQRRQSKGETSTRTGHILVADDDKNVQYLLKRLLTRAGHTVSLVGDGEQALESLSNSEPDLVITDIDMPIINGIELLRCAHEVYPDLKVILLTGKPKVDVAANGVRHGAFRFLTKPVDHTSLLQDVQDGLDKALQERHLRSLAMKELKNEVGDDEEQRFERALDGLWMAFQPLYGRDGSTLYGYEALMRSREPSMSNPALLIETAEKLDELRRLGRMVRARSAEAFCAHAAPGTSLFVNLHPLELLDPQLYTFDAPLSRIAPNVILEITERTSLGEVDDIVGRLRRLRRLGFRIAVDDLGAGYASLTSLGELRPDIVKLDMGLVRDVDKNRIRQSIIGSILHLCHELEIQVVAEGVETDKERMVLVGMGCDLLQGYLLARPTPPEKLSALDGFQAFSSRAS